MAAKNKSELLLATNLEFEKLERVLLQLPEKLRLAKDGEDTSPKDILGHRGHWIELFLGWYRDGQAGRKVFFPAEGYKWNETRRYNADLRSAQAGLSWEAALELLSARHQDLIHLVEGLTEEELYGAPMKGANNHWPTGRWAEAAGPSHYRSAAKYLRMRIREAAKSD